MHVDDAGHSKDGPSAGVTFAAALVSSLATHPLRSDVAMTGELTLAGTVERVASIREKVLAACRAGMTTVILPAANKADVTDIFGDEPAVPHHHSLREDDRRCVRGGAARHRGVEAGSGRLAEKTCLGHSRRHCLGHPGTRMSESSLVMDALTLKKLYEFQLGGDAAVRWPGRTERPGGPGRDHSLEACDEDD